MVITSILLLVPWRGWVFSLSARKIIRDYIEADSACSLPEIQRDLALHLDNRADGNQLRLNRLYWLLSLAGILLAAEVLTWLIILLEWKSQTMIRKSLSRTKAATYSILFPSRNPAYHGNACSAWHRFLHRPDRPFPTARHVVEGAQLEEGRLLQVLSPGNWGDTGGAMAKVSGRVA